MTMTEERPKLTMLPGEDRQGDVVSFLLNYPQSFMHELLSAIGVTDEIRVAVLRHLWDTSVAAAQEIQKGATLDTEMEWTSESMTEFLAEHFPGYVSG
jgi:hypothetical protein